MPSRSFWIILAITLVAFLIYLPFSPMWQQRVGMQQASALQERIEQRMPIDPADESIRLAVSTHPSLFVSYEGIERPVADRLVQITREEYARMENCPRVNFRVKVSGETIEYRPLPKK